jgi:hypothetical protein
VKYSYSLSSVPLSVSLASISGYLKSVDQTQSLSYAGQVL